MLEGDLHVVEEQEKDKSDKMQYCIQKNVWDKINNCINELVDDITLEDLAVKYQKMNGMDNHMYYI